jgi:predicted peptidase
VPIHRRILVSLLALVIASGNGAAAADVTESGEFEPEAAPEFARFQASNVHTARAAGFNKAPQGFWEYLPPGYSSTGPGSPLLLFFHGLGENGDGSEGALASVLLNGPPLYIDRNEWPRERPFIVLSPQQGAGCPDARSITAFLRWARGSYNVDASRIYLTGLSCGAIGIADYLRANALSTEVAAVVTISGDWRSAWKNRTCGLGRVPAWVIHGDADANPGTLPAFSREPVENLMACQAPPREEVILTLLPGVGHDGAAWNGSYDGSYGFDVFEWLLRQARR